MRDDPACADSDLDLERCLERLVITGTPQMVADQILDFRQDVGEFGTLLYTGHDWVEPGPARRSMELMAREVMPRVNEALKTATASGRAATGAADVPAAHSGGLPR